MYKHRNEKDSKSGIDADRARSLETFEEKISKNEDVVDLQMEQNKTINDIIGTTFKDLTFPGEINSAILNGIAKYAIEESSPATSENRNEIECKIVSQKNTSHVGKATNDVTTEDVQDPVTPLNNNLINLQLEQNSLALMASDDIMKLLPADLATDFFQFFQENIISICAMEDSGSAPTCRKPNNIIVGDNNDTKLQREDQLHCGPSNSNDNLKSKPEIQNNSSSILQQSDLLPFQLEQNALVESSSVIPSEISCCLSEEMNKAIKQALNKNIQIVSNSTTTDNLYKTRDQGRNGVWHVDHFQI